MEKYKPVLIIPIAAIEFIKNDQLIMKFVWRYHGRVGKNGRKKILWQEKITKIKCADVYEIFIV